MGYNDGHRKTSQELIDEAVLEAIEKPRREAEIARRVALVGSLEPLATAEVGTVLTFSKKGDKGKDSTSYAAIKVGDDSWAVTGDGYCSNGQRHTFKGMVEWMTTGSNLVEGVRKATKFEAVSPVAS